MQSLLEFMNRDRLKKYKSRAYVPQTTDEMRKLVIKLVKERGKYANLNDIDTSNIKDMSGMFCGLDFDGDISQWDVSGVTNMSSMFTNSKFTGLHSSFINWDTKKLENIDAMFLNSPFENKDIEKWSMDNITKCSATFLCCPFKGDLSGWKFKKNVKSEAFANNYLASFPDNLPPSLKEGGVY